MECTDTLYAVKDCLFIEVSFFPVNLLKRSAIIHLYMNITLTIEEPYTEAEYDGHVQLDAETKGSCEESNEQATGYHHRFTSLLVRQCTPDVAEGWGMEEGDTVKYDMRDADTSPWDMLQFIHYQTEMMQQRCPNCTRTPTHVYSKLLIPHNLMSCCTASDVYIHTVYMYLPKNLPRNNDDAMKPAYFPVQVMTCEHV